MRVLVTGNLGYIGSVLTPILLKRGHHVIGLDSDLYFRCNFIGRVGFGIETIRQDIRDIERRQLDGIDAIIHLAALSNDPLGEIDPDLTYQINYQASVRLAELAKAAKVRRFLFSSSCSTYGASNDQYLDESSALRPVTEYGRTKVMVEQDVAAMASNSFCPTSFRNSTAYGTSPRLRLDLVLNNLAGWAHTTGRIVLQSDGTPWRPLVHVADICQAFAAGLETPEAILRGQAFNIGSTQENYQVAELATIVCRAVPGCKVSFGSVAADDKRCYRVNCDKATQSLNGFLPDWTTLRGVKELLQCYRKFKLTPSEFEGPRFHRVAQIRKLIADGILSEELRFRKSRIESLVNV